jgi:16S rRNA (guanine966-N2)-methyltransferase
LRIIAGEYRGRKLSPIRGHLIRPTADRIRESIFNILGVHTRDAVVLDLFAGTGALGLEALSRGAASTVFVDNNKMALSVVRKSIQMMGVDARTQIIRWDIGKDLNCIRAERQIEPGGISTGQGEPSLTGFTLVFMDPPYNRDLVGKALIHLSRSDALSEDAVLVVEHSPSEPISKDIPGYHVVDQRVYGRISVSFLRVSA